MLSVEHLNKTFATPAGPLTVLSDISFQLDRQHSIAITGPSGSGKSTLLQILGTLDRPTSGTITLQATDPFSLRPDELAHFRNRHIGFVFQDHYLLPQLTLWQNTLVPALASGNTISVATRERAQTLLTRVGLGDRLEHRPGELSGGQRQRAAIARALLLEPTLVLADEPTGNLDAEHGRLVSDTLLDLLRNESAALIVVTHSRPLADRMQHEMALLDGRLETLR